MLIMYSNVFNTNSKENSNRGKCNCNGNGNSNSNKRSKTSNSKWRNKMKSWNMHRLENISQQSSWFYFSQIMLIYLSYLFIIGAYLEADALSLDTSANANLTDLGSPALSAVYSALIPEGTQQIFELKNKVIINDLAPLKSESEEVSYTLSSNLKINSVWHANKSQLLQVYFLETAINAPAKKQRTIAKIPDRPFYISLIDGIPQKVIAHTSRDQSLLNLERSIASLLQLKNTDGPATELDISGQCNSFYVVKSTTHIEKTKTDCSHWDLRVNYRSELPLSVIHLSKEQVNFELTADHSLLSAISSETHRVVLQAKPDLGSIINSRLELHHRTTGEDQITQLSYPTLDEAIGSLLEWYRVFDIEADVDGVISELKDTSLKEQVAAHIETLRIENTGTFQLALSFAQLLPIARISKENEFVDVLVTNKELQPQLVDLLGAVQTLAAHNAVKTVIKYDDDVELFEKYLQSLAVGTHPERAIIEDLLKLLKLTNEHAIKNEKLYDTITQTVAALTHHLTLEIDDPLLEKVRTHILAGLQTRCSSDDDTNCKTLFLRALQNLQDVSTIDVLMQYASKSEPKVTVTALQALKAFPLVHFKEQQRKQFEEIFYQSKRKYDSSARTLALDILLALKPNPEHLRHILDYLASNDRQFEVKTYVWQKLRMIAEKCPRFRALLDTSLSNYYKVKNYHVLAQKGLTTVLTRQLTQTPAFNESLLSIQEVYQGILKRGSVELILNAGRAETSSFKLGLYTNGLNFMIGDVDTDDSLPLDDGDNEDSTVTAGMEISVQGTLMRPLVLFNGQTDLMGHVWGGTAAEPTPAYQATTLAQDHEHYIILASGATAYIRVLGARSIDLNGQVTFSIWNRNAQTEIQQNTGSAIVGHVVVGFTYGKLINDFILTQEPKLSLHADVDFYSDIKLCMQLQRPELLLTYTSNKTLLLQNVERSYMKRTSKTINHTSPGRTLALNQKNNDMCNMIINS